MTTRQNTRWKDSASDGVYFDVADVTTGKVHLWLVDAKEALEAVVDHDVEAFGCNATHVIRSHGHPFIAAVHEAFSLHLPLVLAPDDVWLCLAQAFAHHINASPEQWRSRLVGSDGRRTITIDRDDFSKGSPDNDWPGVFPEFSDEIARSVGRTRELVVSDFSTTGLVERAASEIVLMNAVQAFFRYQVRTRCGIPRVKLLGTVEDWRAIRRRAAVFAEYDLRWWTDSLLPVLEQLVAAREGNVDRPFWNSLYKRDGMSGDPWVTGWINTFFPYLLDPETNTTTVVNSAAQNWNSAPSVEIDLSRFPAGLSRVAFMWNYFGTIFPMQFLGGFVGVAHDPETLAVRPSIGWAVRQTGDPVPNTPENWDPN